MHFTENPSQPRIILTLFIFFLLSYSTLLADIIELKDQKKLYGQLISITEASVQIETISKDNASTENVFLPRNKVNKITDESGTVLFSDNVQHIAVLKRYYALPISNWEELKDRLKGSKNDTLYFEDGSKRGGKIFSVTPEFIFMQKISNGKPISPKVLMDKFRLKKVTKVNQIKVIITNPMQSGTTFNKKIEYPVYSISGGIVFAQTNYDQLQGLFQEFYDKSPGITFTADKRLSGYLGGQVQFEIFVKPYLSFGFSGFLYNPKNINALGMSMADIKYTFHQISFRPWVSLGFAGHDFSSNEKIGNTKYIWDTSKGAASLAVGVDLGNELGSGYYISAHYLPFGKGTTKIKDSDISVKKEIDFTIILVSVGMRFNFNL